MRLARATRVGKCMMALVFHFVTGCWRYSVIVVIFVCPDDDHSVAPVVGRNLTGATWIGVALVDVHLQENEHVDADLQ